MNKAKKLTNCKFVNLFDVPDGKGGYYTIASRKDAADLAALNPKRMPSADAVIILAEYQNHVVFVSQYRPGIGRDTIELPAGLVDKGETMIEAATRELFEETGLQAAYIKNVMPPKFSSAGITDETIGVVHFVCYATPEPSLDHLDDGEQIKNVILIEKDKAADFAMENSLGIRTALVVKAFLD